MRFGGKSFEIKLANDQREMTLNLKPDAEGHRERKESGHGKQKQANKEREKRKNRVKEAEN